MYMMKNALIRLYFAGNTESFISLSEFSQKACHVSRLQQAIRKKMITDSYFKA